MRRRDEVLVGLFTTLALIITALGSIWLIRGGLAAGYPLYARFDWGAGIKQGAPIWLVGVTVGYVEKVDLGPSGTLVVGFRIEEQYRCRAARSRASCPTASLRHGGRAHAAGT